MLFAYMCETVYRVLYSCKHLRVSDMEGIVKDPRWKTLSHSPQEWSHTWLQVRKCVQNRTLCWSGDADHGQ